MFLSLLNARPPMDFVDSLIVYASSVAVVMAARSLIQLFRDSNPELLHKRDRVSPCNIGLPQYMWVQ